MEQFNKILHIALCSILFSLGLLFLHLYTKPYIRLLDLTNDHSKEVLYQQYYSVDQMIVTRAEIVSTLFRPLEYDIKIDDILIQKSNHSMDQISSYNIESQAYSRRYQYDLAGNLMMVIYQSSNKPMQ